MSNDPVVMYLVVRESLGLSPGKVGEQCAHASNGIMLRFFKAELLKAKCAKCDAVFPAEEEEHIRLMMEWLHHSSTIIVKRASDAEWAKLKEENRDCYVAKAPGNTEVVAGTETVAGLWPRHKSDADKLIHRLQLL